MQTCANQAHALLLDLGLPHTLWAEAMMHSTWLQNRSTTYALDRKTPYEARNGRIPNLAEIHEFGAAAYMKDITTGKLDLQAQVGHFIGYNSESKGYHIYWPDTHSVTVEQNIILNKGDVLI